MGVSRWYNHTNLKKGTAAYGRKFTVHSNISYKPREPADAVDFFSKQAVT